MAENYAATVLTRLATRTRVRREEMGLSLAALASRTDVSKGHLHNIEHERAPGVTVASAASIAQALGMPLASLLDGDASVTPREMRLLLTVRELYPDAPSTPQPQRLP